MQIGGTMRAFLVTILLATFVVAGTAQSKDHTGERSVVLEFPDQNVSVFVLAERELSRFHTKGTNVEIIANCEKHLLQISGVGEISYKTHQITFSKQGVSIDGKQLPSGAKNFVLAQNGEVQEGFVRTFDREPHK
jgi:hypothetical protein